MKIMQKATWILFFIFIFGTSLTAWAVPIISCDEPKWEFEKVMEGKELSHSFKIKNSGDEVLNLENVRGSCGCTAAKPDSKVLQPGEETEIKTTFNTTGRTGKQTKYVYVHSNDPETKILKLTITGEVEKKPAPRIILRPPSWNMQSIESDITQETNLTILNTGDEPLEIESVSPSTEKLETDFKDPTTLKPEEQIVIKITFNADIMSTTIREKIIIKSNDPKRGDAIFNVYGSINIENKGLNLFVLNVKEEGDNKQIDLYIKNNETYPLNLKVPEAKEPNMVVIPPKNFKRFNLTLPADHSGKNSENKANTNETLQNLKMELSLPIPLRKPLPSKTPTKISSSPSDNPAIPNIRKTDGSSLQKILPVPETK